jgi:hypothetical protein
MTRQDALVIIWRRLLIILVVVLAICAAVTFYGGNERVTSLVFLLGNVGGYVSAHRSLASMTDDEVINFSGSWLGLVVPPLVGGILGIVLYILFLSNLIGGDVFPKFEADKNAPIGFEALFYQHAVDMPAYAKLFFWAFIAGFNQNYVVDLINSVRSK